MCNSQVTIFCLCLDQGQWEYSANLNKEDLKKEREKFLDSEEAEALRTDGGAKAAHWTVLEVHFSRG